MRQADVYGVTLPEGEVAYVELVLEVADAVAFDGSFLVNQLAYDHVVMVLLRGMHRLVHFHRQLQEGVCLVCAQLGIEAVVAIGSHRADVEVQRVGLIPSCRGDMGKLMVCHLLLTAAEDEQRQHDERY